MYIVLFPTGQAAHWLQIIQTWWCPLRSVSCSAPRCGFDFSLLSAGQVFILIIIFLIFRFLKFGMEKGVFLFYWFGFYSCFLAVSGNGN